MYKIKVEPYPPSSYSHAASTTTVSTQFVQPLTVHFGPNSFTPISNAHIGPMVGIRNTCTLCKKHFYAEQKITVIFEDLPREGLNINLRVDAAFCKDCITRVMLLPTEEFEDALVEHLNLWAR